MITKLAIQEKRTCKQAYAVPTRSGSCYHGEHQVFPGLGGFPEQAEFFPERLGVGFR